MWKSIVSAAVGATLVGATLLQAQGRPPEMGGDRRELTSEDRAALLDARIAALKAGLKLTPGQEANWTAFEQASRNLAKLHLEHRAKESETPSSDPIERLQHRADRVLKFGTALKQFADAAAPLYQSLDDSQKRRFRILASYLRPRTGHHRFEFMHHQFEHRDFGRDHEHRDFGPGEGR